MRKADTRPQERDPSIADRLGDVVEVIPWPIRLLLAVLALVGLVLGGRALLLGARARRLREQREELRRDVGQLQAVLLPELPEETAGGGLSAAYRPAAGLAAGGDFYDAFSLPGERVGLLVGDICGHGRESIEQAAMLRYALRAYLEAGLEPRDALAVAGESVGDNLGDRFATVLVASYDPAAGTLTYASAGHPPPIVLGPEAHEPVIVFGSPPIGMGRPTGRRQTTISLAAPSFACLHTDGLTEARADGEMLGHERLAQILSALGPGGTAASLLDRVAEEADEVSDDMAACIFRPGANGSHPEVWIEELEADAYELLGPHLERFLAACGLAADELSLACRSVMLAAEETGGAIVRVLRQDGKLVWDVDSAGKDSAPASKLAPVGGR